MAQKDTILLVVLNGKITVILPSTVSDEFNILYQKSKFWLLLSFKHLGSYSDD